MHYINHIFSIYKYWSIFPKPIVFYSQRAYFEMENEFRMLAKLIRLQRTFFSACVCAHQCMYVHAFVLIIRLHWPLRWHHSLWIVNTEQIKILFKSLPRKLASREREASTLNQYCLLFPQPCFLFSTMSECLLHVYNTIPLLFSSTATPLQRNGYYLKGRKRYIPSKGGKYFFLFFWEIDKRYPNWKQKNFRFFSFFHEFLLDVTWHRHCASCAGSLCS